MYKPAPLQSLGYHLKICYYHQYMHQSCVALKLAAQTSLRTAMPSCSLLQHMRNNGRASVTQLRTIFRSPFIRPVAYCTLLT